MALDGDNVVDNGDSSRTPSSCDEPPLKRSKVTTDASGAAAAAANEASFTERLCEALLCKNGVLPIPSCLVQFQCKLSITKLKELFDNHGFRTSVVKSPRPALSIYKDSCQLPSSQQPAHHPLDSGMAYLIIMLGMHPDQSKLEEWYLTHIKKLYALCLFLKRLELICTKSLEHDKVKQLVANAKNFLSNIQTNQDCRKANLVLTKQIIAPLMQAILETDPGIRPEQLERELERFEFYNSTLSNAFAQALLVDHHQCLWKDVYFKCCPQSPRFERITIYIYDPDVDQFKVPLRFTFLPALHQILHNGLEAVVTDMVKTFWSTLLQHGYYCTKSLESEMGPQLVQFFSSGLGDPTIPIKLNAHFDPTFPLALYLHGKAGAGKSSLVRHTTPSLQAAIVKHADPEMLARHVKQNLNKDMKTLELELQLRPNNNDLSVMSIIRGRRMTMTQSKPGLVVINLEEVARHDEMANPNQLDTCRLMSQRFAGRTGQFQSTEGAPPRNSTKRGISGDASLVVLMTSNYPLHASGQEALGRLHMFSQLKQINVSAIEGEDRRAFALAYLRQCVAERNLDNISMISTTAAKLKIDLQMDLGHGDIRPLVRHLRMLAFYLCVQLEKQNNNDDNNGSTNGETMVQITEDNGPTKRTTILQVGKHRIELAKSGNQDFDNLLPVVHQCFDSRTQSFISSLTQDAKKSKNDNSNNNSMSEKYKELSQVVDFYFAKTLCPAVIVSHDENLIQTLIQSLERQDDVYAIGRVDPLKYKMMKSLYDPNDTPNLRDDIFRHKKQSATFVATELVVNNTDAQLCIREMIEDSPSMTAFSTCKSALYKDGLLFAIYVAKDCPITPELRSRASIIV